MTTVVAEITQGADDGYDKSTSFSTSEFIVAAGFLFDAQRTYLRFAVAVPQGATITGATLTAHEAALSNTADTIIRAEAADDPAAPTSSADMAARTRTTATTVWNLTSASGTIVSPDLSEVIQEVVDRPGWASGNALLLIWEPPTATGPDFHRIVVSSIEGGSPASLSVDYTTGPVAQDESGGAGMAVTVTATGDGVGDTSFTVDADVVGPDVNLSWSAQVDAVGYAVERDGQTVAWNVQTTSYTDTPGTGAHTYRVGVIV